MREKDKIKKNAWEKSHPFQLCDVSTHCFLTEIFVWKCKVEVHCLEHFLKRIIHTHNHQSALSFLTEATSCGTVKFLVVSFVFFVLRHH